jgi:hypothetical protein
MNLALLDKDTLRVVLAITELTLVPIAALIWKGNRDIKGVSWWLAGSVSTMRGCAEFCVNGQSTAGASRLVRKHNDIQEARSTRTTVGQPAGRLQEA